MKSITWKVFVAGLVAVIAALIVLSGVYTRFVAPEGIGFYAFVFGGRGAVELLMSAVTLVAALITVILLFRRAAVDSRQLEMAERSALLSLYKEGATLLAGDKQNANTNGALMIASLAVQHPDRFLGPAAAALTSYLHDHTHDRWQSFADAMQSGGLLPEHRGSSKAVITAVGAIGSLRRTHPGEPWPDEMGRASGRLAIDHLYIGDATLAWNDFSFCEFFELITFRLTFWRCSFVNSEIHALSDDKIVFRDCNLTNLKLVVRDLSRTYRPNVIVEDCVVQGATINGAHLTPT